MALRSPTSAGVLSLACRVPYSGRLYGKRDENVAYEMLASDSFAGVMSLLYG